MGFFVLFTANFYAPVPADADTALSERNRVSKVDQLSTHFSQSVVQVSGCTANSMSRHIVVFKFSNKTSDQMLSKIVVCKTV